MFLVTRYLMFPKLNWVRSGIKEIPPGSGSGSSTRWALIRALYKCVILLGELIFTNYLVQESLIKWGIIMLIFVDARPFPLPCYLFSINSLSSFCITSTPVLVSRLRNRNTSWKIAVEIFLLMKHMAFFTLRQCSERTHFSFLEQTFKWSLNSVII